MGKVVEIACDVSGKRSSQIRETDAVDQDIGIYGDDADDFVDRLCDEFGNWVADWPWNKFLNFNEDPLGRFLHRTRSRFAKNAFPLGRPPEHRLELRHIAAVIEKGEWVEP